MLKTCFGTLPRLTTPVTVRSAAPSLNIGTRTFQTSASKAAAAASPKMEAYKKVGNRENAPPKHEMVHFPGLMSEKRSFGDFRTVLHTGLYSAFSPHIQIKERIPSISNTTTTGQVVAMEVPVNGDIGDEVHLVDQILLFTSGRGLATVNGKDQEVKAGDVVVVPAGTQHQFVTKGDQPL